MGAGDAQAGTLVARRGAIGAGAAGGVGGVVGAALSERQNKKGQGSNIDLGNDLAYLAIVSDTLTLFKTKRSLVGLKPKLTDEVLVTVPRSDLTGSTFQKGAIVSVFELDFQDGSSWQFDVPRQSRKDGEKMAQMLGSTIQ